MCVTLDYEMLLLPYVGKVILSLGVKWFGVVALALSRH